VRVKVPDGTKLMPHKHPEDRVYTVMSGVFYIGLGQTFDGPRTSRPFILPPGQVSSRCSIWAGNGQANRGD
jgi:quercetin dioxygenase-like cupin family protein